MMKFEIKNRFDGKVLYSGDHETLKDAVKAAYLSGANLYGAYLYGAYLYGANLSGADLSGADLSGANLSGANLSGADLSGADLSGAYLYGANLSGAYLYGAYLYGANLSGADLSGADLSGADLSGAYLYGANLSGADLSKIRADFFEVLDAAPFEVGMLRIALEEGWVDGSTYSGECACLVGTIAKARLCSDVNMLEGLKPDANRPAERWFVAIKPGLPITYPVVEITLKWIDEWIAERTAQYQESLS
jgi:Pentapeptide repeats (8 copies)